MKIISQVDTSNWTYPYTCDNCETQLEIEKKDISTNDDLQFYCGVCPVCNETINIAASLIPKAVKVEIKNIALNKLSNHEISK